VNVLFVMSDSLSPHYMGAYGDASGSTPNLDRVAQRGVLFERAYCNSPLCAPSRASMMAGRYASELGSLDNANPFSEEWPTLAHVFKRAGYETTLVGKMHFAGYDQWHGFDRHLANETDYSRGYNPRVYALAYDWDQPSAPNPNGTDWMGPSYVKDKHWDSYTAHYDWDVTIHREAVDYLSKQKPGGAPFFCCVSYHHPHNPFYMPEKMKKAFEEAELPLPEIPDDMRERYGVMEKWLFDFHHQGGRYDQIKDKENLRWLFETYYAMVRDMDTHAGELLDLLKANGLLENTIVVFTSDHGDMLGHRGMIQKRCFYERAARVPLLVSFPGHYAEGKRIQTPVSLVDLTPTFAGMAGVPSPEGVPGQNLMPSILTVNEPEDRGVFCEYHGEGVHAPCFMVVGGIGEPQGAAGRHKYIYVHGHEERLYDLANDPEELCDLSEDKAHFSIKEKFKAKLLQQFDPGQITANARQSQKNRNYIFKACQAK